MKIIPYGNNILVKPIEKKQVLVSQSKTLCEYGEVVAIGSDVQFVKVGDVIGYTIWGLNSLEIDNEKHYFVQEQSEFILGKLEE